MYTVPPPLELLYLDFTGQRFDGFIFLRNSDRKNAVIEISINFANLIGVLIHAKPTREG